MSDNGDMELRNAMRILENRLLECIAHSDDVSKGAFELAAQVEARAESTERYLGIDEQKPTRLHRLEMEIARLGNRVTALEPDESLPQEAIGYCETSDRPFDMSGTTGYQTEPTYHHTMAPIVDSTAWTDQSGGAKSAEKTMPTVHEWAVAESLRVLIESWKKKGLTLTTTQIKLAESVLAEWTRNR